MADQQLLSPRECDVLAYFARGFTYSQISRRMGIAVHTVDTYLRRIRKKTGARNSADLVRLGLELTLPNPEARTGS
jgi:DNA-binding CsgD family transcriptional regulator